MSGGQGLQRLDNTSPVARRKPERPSLSCTECRRRKQKCNQGKPCTNCSRRFPQPICEYDTKVSRRSKRAGAQPSEDSTLDVVDKDGPYSHLKYAGVHDAILQIELPTRVIKRESTDAESGGYPSSSEDPTDADSPEPWRPFNNPARDPKVANASKIINKAIRKIVQERSTASDVVRNGDWYISSEMVMRAAHEAMPPPKPVDNFFDDLRHLPMVPTRLNNELVRTHLQLLCRFKVSIDGNPGPDNAFMRHWIPYTIQEPAMLQVVLYTSACFLKETGHVPKTLAMAYKGAAYQALNKSLRNEKTQCSDGVVLAVGQLIMDEWYWGSTTDLHAHRHGLRMMIRMRGGLQYLGMHGFLAKMLLLNDAGLALAHEIEPGLFDRPGFGFEDPIMVPFQTSLNSPFVSGWPTFASSSSSAFMHPSTAAILDDMRLLIETVLSGLDENFEHNDPQKLTKTVSWIEQRLKALPQEILQLPDRHSREPTTSPTADSNDSTYSSPAERVPNAPDPTYSWVRRTATIYCRAISNRQPLRMACTPPDFEYLWQFTFRIQTDASWATVGILFWVITAIMPASLSHPGTRFMKTVMICCLMNMGVDNWHVAADAVRGALKLQKWLEGGRERNNRIFGGGKGIDKHGFALKDKLGNFGLTPHYEDGEYDAG